MIFFGIKLSQEMFDTTHHDKWGGGGGGGGSRSIVAYGMET